MTTLTLASIEVALPPNLQRITAQADLYTLGVALLSFLEVADEQEAIERAEGREAYLLKSNVLPVWYLIFPLAFVKPYRKESNGRS